MIPRLLASRMVERLEESPAVALVGPRQVGKTTLAIEIAQTRPSVYLDLESDRDRAKLADAVQFLSGYADRLVILDEVHRMPDLFRSLRGLIDEGRRQGLRTGRFLLLGSASVDLLKQSSESLAGRISYLELGPFDALEVPAADIERLWIRGGFPESFLAKSEVASSHWRSDFIRTYLERDIPQLGPRIPAETLRRLWVMLAHLQGATLNLAQIAGSLGVSGKTAASYLDLMHDLLLVRRLEPWSGNTRKRLVRSPKVYIRDSGLVHSLLGLDDRDAVFGHPVAGRSWEGLVIENLCTVATDATVSFYRTAAGAEADLLLEWGSKRRWLFEVKLGLAPRLERGFYSAMEELKPDRAFVIYGGQESYPLSPKVQALGLREAMDLLAEGA